MKKQFKSLLLLVCLISMALPSWGQASTQGREFWVALTASRGPDHAQPSAAPNGFRPYIAVSAPKPCTIEISNPQTNWSLTRTISAANTWEEILTGTKATEIPLEQWYSKTNQPDSETRGYYHGLKVRVLEDVDVSVYSALWWSKSFDATNVLPIHALGSEYIVETYGPSTKDGVHQNVFTILATENCRVRITPSANTEGGHGAHTSFEVDLLEGEVYHVKSASDQDLNGSIVKALNDKKIAVYAGCILGNVPSDVADRDLLYEELFPLEYWGCDFVVARSKEKDANRIMIIAEKGTDVTIYGTYHENTSTTTTESTPYSFYLPAGEVYEFELSAGNAEGRWDSKRNGNLHGITVVDSAVYIHTECPCAVMSFDVGNGYIRKDNGSEEKSSRGAPSMTWVSPIQQMMQDVVFGVMGTTNTHDHFLNVIAKTVDCANVTLTNNKTNTALSLDFHPVDGKNTYSYARVRLDKTSGGVGSGNNPVYHLACPNGGFIASVYGNGTDESYAYTVGSSAIKRGVNVNNIPFDDGLHSDKKFCMGDTLRFDAQVGHDMITRVDWNFGDGITDYNSTAQTEHCYTVPGWYDVEADLYGHQVCTDEADQLIGHVKFSFRVVRQDTVWVDPSKHCLTQEEWADTIRIKGQNYLDSLVNFGRMEILNPDAPCTEPIQISLTTYGLETSRYATVDEFDSAYVHGKWYFPQTLPPDGIVSWYTEYANEYGCRLYDTCYVHIKTCLDMDIPNSGAHACQGDTVILPFNYKKGDIAEAHFVYGKTNVKIEPKKKSLDWYFELPTDKLKPDYYQATITVQDTICNRKLEFPIEFAIYYPSSIFKCKFNNVLAVYNKENNGGYEFTGYQWLLDGAPIPGATQSVYHLDTTFVIGQYYSVILTRSDGVILPSCAQMIEKVNNYVSESNKAPATKHLINQRLVIRKDEKDYNIYGQRMR